MNKENCALKLVDEIILYYDARSIKLQIINETTNNVHEVIHKSINVRNVKGFRSTAAFTINGSARWRWVMNFTLRPLYPRKMAPERIENDTVWGPRAGLGDTKNFLAPAEYDSSFIDIIRCCNTDWSIGVCRQLHSNIFFVWQIQPRDLRICAVIMGGPGKRQISVW